MDTPKYFIMNPLQIKLVKRPNLITNEIDKKFYSKMLQLKSYYKIIEKYNHIPVEFEIATFTSWK